MIIPRRLEEVLVAVDHTRYDRVVAAIAETGIFHVDEVPEELSSWKDRSFAKNIAET